MPLSIKVNLRVTGHCNQGGRKYMEDMFSVAYQQTSDDKDLEYAFFGIFDGHGGGEAATFAKEHLMDIIVKQRNFWSDKDEDVLRAIKDGYINTHYAMWRELDKWPTTASGLPSTAGTTASIAFIRKGKIYIGHVGDSGIILGYQEEGDPQWKAKALTKDHKPESGPEMIRIQESGGKVVSKSGVPRVVWNRPRIGHKGPVRRSTHIDEIPFLAVARSLGDLWSYNSELDTFVVSPEPDVKVVTVDVKSQRCLIFGTDGLWNMLTPQAAVAIVQSAERHNEKHLIASQQTGHAQADAQMWINPSKSLVDTALERWFSTRLRADNTSVVTLMLDPPGPSRSEVLMSRKNDSTISPKHDVASIPRTVTPIVPPESMVQPLEVPVTSETSVDDQAPSPKVPDTSDASYSNNILANKPQELESNEIAETPKSTSENVKDNESEDVTVSESTCRESIQVAEISSSDIIFEETYKPTIEDSNEIEPTADTIDENVSTNDSSETSNTDSTSELTCNPACDVNTIVSNPTTLEKVSSKSDKSGTGLSVLLRQNAFCGSCEELQNRPRLRRDVRRPYASVNLDRSHEPKDPPGIVAISNVPTRRPSGLLVTHLEPKTGRRHIVNASSGFRGERQKSYFTPVGPRLKRDSMGGLSCKFESPPNENPCKTASSMDSSEGTTVVGSKRRHSSTSERAEPPKCSVVPEPSTKRRTRSEDRPGPTDENDPSNQGKLPQQQTQPQKQHSRLRWPEESISSLRSRRGSCSAGSTSGATSTSLGGQEKLPSPTSFQRRSLEKKATPVKTIRRPSINGSSRPQLRGSFALREWDQSKSGHRPPCTGRSRLNRTVGGVIGSPNDSSPVPSLQRWLRSDTLAATPVKTLRSRNIDIDGHTIPAQIAHQYGIVKPNRLSLPAKLKLANKVSKPSSPASSSSSSSTTSVSTPSSSTSANNFASGKLTKQNITVNNGNASTTNANSGTSTSSVITKRVKSPYNPAARSALGTRSRLKRLGK
ncbi:flocculation protein FLO11 [Venturia canescens]|uniref:flocculation protein FLO11 n=1 Tax=Venturia canescens TaxID=32260 RepID=UPI001C9C4EE7|nr:flocculation protein FLO11 [Venturia canescens]XP_043289775.1 flocculation protein FLO11 [Venturia canescens]